MIHTLQSLFHEHGAPLVVALYPRTESLNQDVAAYRHQPGDDTAPRIAISTVDVGAALLLDDPAGRSVRGQLEHLVRMALGSREHMTIRAIIDASSRPSVP